MYGSGASLVVLVGGREDAAAEMCASGKHRLLSDLKWPAHQASDFTCPSCTPP